MTLTNSNLGEGRGIRNRAFTLIELLAVIIIIGVIALIVSPIILNVVGKSKKAAFERSIDGIIEAVRIDLSDDDFLTPREYFYEGSELSLLTVSDKKRNEIVKISGRIDGNGLIIVDGDGNIIINNICNKEYCANGKEENIEISKNPTVETTGSLTATLGEQTVTYKAIDQAGNEKSVIRKFTVVEAEGPILNFSNASTGGSWTKAQTIKATATDNSNLQTFTYEVIKDGTSGGIQNVSVSGKSAEVDIALNESGTYSIKLTGSDIHNNTNTLNSGEYKIDVTEPTVESVTPSGTVGSNGWYTSNVTFTVTDGSDTLSGHKSTTVSPTSITSNTSGKNVTVTTEDNAGNKSTVTFGPYKIDKTAPTFTVKSESTPTIKPNLSSLRNQNVSTQFTTSQKFSASGNSYGISTSADAHMMKNSEWGAVAYLSQSKYGKYGNSSYSGVNKEVYINNNSNYTTGCSSGAPSTSSTSLCTNTYNVSPGGTGASTTGTIYGVYDMSGGAREYVMVVYNNIISKAGFSSLPSVKYYDNYTTTTLATACSGGICYGHALNETARWYSDSVAFIACELPMVSSWRRV